MHTLGITGLEHPLAPTEEDIEDYVEELFAQIATGKDVSLKINQLPMRQSNLRCFTWHKGGDQKDPSIGQPKRN